MIDTGVIRTVSAYNSAKHSGNIVHSDEYARSRGYRGGLVPGSDICGYLSHAAIAQWGDAWLMNGWSSYRLVNPVYEGDAAATRILSIEAGDTPARLPKQLDEQIDAQIDAQIEVGEEFNASASFRPQHGLSVDTLSEIPRLASGPDKVPANEQSLSAGVVLPEIERTVSLDHALVILDELREDLPPMLERAVIHPGYLLRMANWAFSNTVALGPWVHVGSELCLFRLCQAPTTLRARAAVLRNFDKKGHGFVELDIRIDSLGTTNSTEPSLVARVLHTAIYQLRDSA